MKKIEAIIKPSKLSNVKDALHEIGLTGMTVSDVKGFGRQRGQDGGLNSSPDYDDEFRVKIKIELVIEDKLIEKALEAIKNAAYSGKIGDGKIFILDIEKIIRIRTGEKDSDAV